MIRIYLLNLVVALIALVFMKLFRVKGSYINFLLILCIPIIGLIISFTIFICRKFIKSDSGNYIFDRENLYGKNISLLIREAELKQPKDIVPVEDTFVLNSNNIKRKLVKDVIKSDFNNSLDVLEKALKDKDIETSHYAASAITHVKSKLFVTLQQKEEVYKYLKNKGTLIDYLEIMKQCIESKLFDSTFYIKLEYRYKELLEVSINDINSEEKYYKELIKVCIRLKEYSKAINYANKYRENNMNSQDPYILLLEIYYTLKDKKNFNKIISDIRKSQIRLDNYSLETLRFWM